MFKKALKCIWMIPVWIFGLWVFVIGPPYFLIKALVYDFHHPEEWTSWSNDPRIGFPFLLFVWIMFFVAMFWHVRKELRDDKAKWMLEHAEKYLDEGKKEEAVYCLEQHAKLRGRKWMDKWCPGESARTSERR